MEDLSDIPPTDINPYEILQVDQSASPSDVKTAYKKLALKHHPDKAQPADRESAHHQFQEIAFAYAILSDERRRKRYDTTGNTSESLDLEDDDFNWSDFFKAQWADAVTGSKLNTFKDTYQNSEEERSDVLSAYESAKGNLDQVFRIVMLSNPLDDEERFRALIDKAIKTGEVEDYDAYSKETSIKKKCRHDFAAREGVEAKAYAKKLGVYDDLFGSKKSKVKKNGELDDEAGLADLIQQRQKGRAANFLDDLEAKYGGGKQSKRQNGVGKTRKEVKEPPEEMFQRNRVKKGKTPEDQIDDNDDEDIVDLDAESHESDDEDCEEPVKVKSRKRPSKRVRRANKRAARKKSRNADE